MRSIAALRPLASFRGIIANAGAVVGSTAILAPLGFVYWWIAARLFPATEVGFAAACISAMQLLAMLATWGCGTLLIGESQRRDDGASRLIVSLSVGTGILGFLFGLVFAVIAPRLVTDLQPLGGNVINAALFALGVALTTATLVLDQAVLGLQRGTLQVIRNAIFASTKLLLLIPAGLFLSQRYSFGIYLTWVLGSLVSLGWLISRRFLNDVHPRDYLPRREMIRSLGRAALQHHFLNIALQASSLLLPLIVTVTLSSVQNAYFYTAWMIVGFVFVPPVALSVSLYAAASSAGTLARKLRFTLGAAVALGFAANIVILLGANLILRPFGDSYAEAAATALRFIALGVFGLIVKDHYVALCRIRDRVSSAIPLITIGSIAELAFAAIGSVYSGLTGLAIGWLIAVCLQGVAMAPAIYRAARPELQQEAPHSDEPTLSQRI